MMDKRKVNGLASEIVGKKIILKLRGRICETAEEVLLNSLCRKVLSHAISNLKKSESRLLDIFTGGKTGQHEQKALIETLVYLTKMRGDVILNIVPEAESFLKDRHLFAEFIEYIYNYWRSFDRFIICNSTGDTLDKRPYRTFNATIEQLTHLIRGIYRDILENVTDSHPTVYRQVRTGAEVATISLIHDIPLPSGPYRKCMRIPVIRQILLYPPLILNPPMNKRSGIFAKVNTNPLDRFDIDTSDWLCYPAKVGPLVILIYFHTMFAELGFSLCNLFELAEDSDLLRKPDAVYLFGVPGTELDKAYGNPTVFHDDEANDVMVAAAPGRPEFGYFGYLKKMVLTLHNIIMMKRGNLPFHGALVKAFLKNDVEATILVIGDTGAGKSETLESLREVGEEYLREMLVIADDMGSLAISEKGDIVGYGTEIGAFLRLDDLKPGYAFGQIDRAIIMNPTQINARIILPVTTFEHVIRGIPINYILYANNYEEIDEDHPLIERFETATQAINVFREGTVMSKGTTAATGITHSYFANIFGPPQYRKLHESIAMNFFEAFFARGLFIGQIRTRLGIPGMERKGPEEASRALLKTVSSSGSVRLRQ